MRKIFPVALILIVVFLLMLNAALKETAIFDETAHIAAGYGYVRYLDYRLNPEHPPLVKALSALPLLFMNLNFPTEAESWQKDVNGQWDVGNRFLYSEGNNPDEIVGAARIFPIILTLLTIILIYVWSLQILGRGWALVPAFLFGFSPSVLAHGHYVTTDVGATLGVLFGFYFFTKMLATPSRKKSILAGLALGAALLMKFSNVLLLPIFIFIGFIHYIAKIKRDGAALHYFLVYFKRFVLMFFAALFLIYAVYFLFTLNYPATKELSDAATTLSSFNPRWLVDLDLALIKNSVLRPLGQYLFGLLMILQRAAGGNTAYFLGDLSAEGWWYYFPVVFLLKEPLPSLIMILLAVIIGVSKFLPAGRQVKFKNFSDYLGTNVAEFGMLVFIVIYWVQSMRSPLNIGIRHLLPTMPFIYILATGTLKSWILKLHEFPHHFLPSLFARIKAFFKISLKFALIIILLVWYAAETFAGSPYYLSYFNEIGGGIKNGYKYVTDSNYDWGQDLKRLAVFVKENNIQKIAVDYFGGGSPKYYLGEDVAENWWSARGNPKDKGIEWLAISVNSLQGAQAIADADLNRKPEDEYSWLRDIKPAARAGTSIFIYKF
ncbi:MAG: Glycosyl transferase, family 39 [Candidatus Jorgensenbacteria bacterium GW2011_GWA1_48_13]|uniref:Glycosyl transferase, family 39 n=2 Tax=Candidatus Joergenseniibacteriota TaxID=1752739 RepID=A0A0G1YJK5_9BACT|nr:MAG: Glycosyl transferase, family 39 [Candidatus Jorgensenbacteria bacterium GW2011_GWA1_48_13]KKU98875.1 MAG: Glycosyl transferase family 39 [Candidatus Jorgensenbacteria bacterium GW2011_GWC1_48_8]KKW15132.1 MAG: Glycosyl transferase, family 39 [Candidatus Jorgensenbacteria bacterium GW2011_GWB1_50_10]